MSKLELKGFLFQLNIGISVTGLFSINVLLPIYWSSRLQLSSESPSKLSASEESMSTEERNEIARKFETEAELEEFKKFLAAEFCLENYLVTFKVSRN